MVQGSRFFGNFEHALDAKGRVILPARLRTSFTGPGFLAPYLEGCLGLWTEEGFETEIAIRLAQAGEGPASRNEVREWSAAVFEAEIDRQGRMAVPPHLREYASLTSEVLIVGAIDRIEFWSPTNWQAKARAVAAAPTGR